MTTTIEPAISSSSAPAPVSAASGPGRANPAARNSFAAALGAAELPKPPCNATVVPASLADTGGSSNPADKAAPSNAPATTKASQKNGPPVTSLPGFVTFLPVQAPAPLPSASLLAASLGVEPLETAAVLQPPVAGINVANVANVATTGASQVQQANQALANANPSVTLLDGVLTSPSAGSGKATDLAQPNSLSAQTWVSDPAQEPIQQTDSQNQISNSIPVETQNASAAEPQNAEPQNVDPVALAVASPSTANLPDLLTGSPLSSAAAGADAPSSAISANARSVSFQTPDADRSSAPGNLAGSSPVSGDTAPPQSPDGTTPGNIPRDLLSSPFVPQPSPLTVSAGARQNSSSPPTLLSALHPLLENALARASNQLHPTPTPSDVQLPATPLNSSSSLAIVPASFSAPKPGPGTESSSSLGSNASPPSTATNRFSSPAGVPAIGAAENKPQSDTSSGDTTDPSPHKGPAATSTQSAGFPPAILQTAAAAVVDPALPPGIPGNIQGALPGASPATLPATSQEPSGQPAAANPSAHKSDSGGPAPDSPSTLPAPGESPATLNAGPVQMAQMVNQAAQSEMRIGLNTAAFGNVEVHTVVHANEVGIQIGSEKGDLRSLLANDLPGIANTLQQQNLRLNQVNFHQPGFAFSNQMSSGGDSQPRSFGSRPQATRVQSGEIFRAESSEAVPTLPSAAIGGLSVLA